MYYSEVIGYIEERNKMGSVLGLENIERLLKRLGNPQNKVPAIHIAGTNGKGSIMAFVENVLIKNGLKVGRYISPTIIDYRERWQINKEYISETDCADILTEVIDTVKEMERLKEGAPTSFEIETAAAFLYFEKSGCDIMLIECGMGGRLDATNVFLHTPIDIIASISYDHMQFLGDTLEKITKEKLGIVKDNDILVTYPFSEIPEKVVVDYVMCRDTDESDSPKTSETKKIRMPDPETGEDDSRDDDREDRIVISKLFAADKKYLDIISSGIKGSSFKYKGKKYDISLVGGYQILNAITAIEAVKAFNSISGKLGLSKITQDVLYEGMKDTSWDGRFTVLSEQPLFIVDGAHNEDAWQRLSEDIRKYFTNRKIIFIIGVLKDKEYEKMLDILSPYMAAAVTVTSDSPRALDGKYLAKLIEERNVKAVFAESIPAAVGKALDMAEEAEADKAAVIACGSLSFIGDIIKIKRKR
ncbi:MAG: bifunctional folylpolyglutamate synthase/dihydrofolate synthase [Eubacterium sp.]|nr:bifunctional folylpolyglutamate synthase/dihydrofolate synthase [Eubacterium sp.]